MKCNATCRDCGDVQFTDWSDSKFVRCELCGGVMDKGGNCKPIKASKRAQQSNGYKRMASYNSYMQSAKWSRKRKIAIKRAKGKCSECGTKKNLQVHHLTYARFGREKQRDLKVLCGDCHRFAHNLPTSLDRELANIVKT